MATKLPYVLPFEDGSVVAAILLKAQGLPETEQIATKTELQQATAYLATLDNATMAPQSATVKRTTDNLQAQINNIVRAPESGGDVGAEVYQARVNEDGRTFETLQERLNYGDATAQQAVQILGTGMLLGEDLDPLTYEIGSIVATTGEVRSQDTTWKYTDYVSVVGVTMLRIIMSTMAVDTSHPGIAFYDSSYRYISGVECRVTGVAEYEERVVSVPTTAAYVRASFRATTPFDMWSFIPSEEKKRLDSAILENSITRSITFYNARVGGYVKPITYSIAGKGAIKVTDGTIHQSTLWYYIDYLDIEGISELALQLPIMTKDLSLGVAFYDANHEFISGEPCPIGTREDNVDIVVNVPASARYVRTSFRIAQEDTFYIGVIAGEGRVAELDRKVDKLDEQVGGYIGIPVTWSIGNWLNQPSGESSSGSKQLKSNSTPNYIKSSIVRKPEDIESIRTLFSDTQVLFVYALVEKSYPSGLQYECLARITASSKSQISLPAGTTYITLCARNSDYSTPVSTSISLQYAASSDLWSAIQNLQEQISPDFSALCLFESIGVISDSISCGWARDKQGNNSRRNVGISWPQQLGRMIGSRVYNLGASGVSATTWFAETYSQWPDPDQGYEYCYKQYKAVEACDLYIIGLGLNGGTLGSVSDINEADYTQNGNTFYGKYAQIIQMINAQHPNSIVICLTEPTTRSSSYDAAVRTICELPYINAILLDLEYDYWNYFNTDAILSEHQPDGLHFTPRGYSLLAKAMAFALSDCIQLNSAKLKYVGVAEPAG